MVEKVITLDDVSLLDFLGVENKNIRLISNAFPQSKVVSRGNEIRIQGSTPEIIKINDMIINSNGMSRTNKGSNKQWQWA